MCLVGSRTPDDPMAPGRRSWSWWLMGGKPKLELFKVCGPGIWFYFYDFSTPYFYSNPNLEGENTAFTLCFYLLIYLFMCCLYF